LIETSLKPRRGVPPAFWTFVLISGGLFLGNQVTGGGPLLRVAFVLAVAVALIVPAIDQPQKAMHVLFCILPFLGLVRRLFVPVAGYSSFDPLLLLSSAVTLVIFITLILTKRANMSGTPLSGMVFFLLFIGVVQIFNPSQADGFKDVMLVGLTGVMFILIPVVCFFVGRSIADEKLITSIQRIILGVGVIAALYGLYQVLIGYPGFEQAYIAKAGFGGLYVGGAIRPFSTFVNPLEYATYLGFAVSTAAAYFLYKRQMQKFWVLGALCLIGYSGYLIGSRGFIYGSGAAVLLIIGLKAKNPFMALLVTGLLVGGIVYWTSTTSGEGVKAADDTAAAQLGARNEIAIKDPFNEKSSTLKVHYRGVKAGLAFAFTERPFGLGTGAATRGGTKFGTGKSQSTELDISDATIAFGVIGGLLYIAIMIRTWFQLYMLRRYTNGPMWPAVAGMTIAAFGQWLNGGNYAVAPLIWFMIGASDLAYQRLRKNQALGEVAQLPGEAPSNRDLGTAVAV
jgi:hypothetical protein